jgi:hypothetical protein
MSLRKLVSLELNKMFSEISQPEGAEKLDNFILPDGSAEVAMFVNQVKEFFVVMREGRFIKGGLAMGSEGAKEMYDACCIKLQNRTNKN